VEDALQSHPAVREAAAIGVPDEKWGELVLAMVVADTVTAAELIAHCRRFLAGYKCPKRIEFVESLPRTATGKLQKFRLRAHYRADHHDADAGLLRPSTPASPPESSTHA